MYVLYIVDLNYDKPKKDIPKNRLYLENPKGSPYWVGGLGFAHIFFSYKEAQTKKAKLDVKCKKPVVFDGLDSLIDSWGQPVKIKKLTPKEEETLFVNLQNKFYALELSQEDVKNKFQTLISTM